MEIYLSTLDRKNIFKFPFIENKNVSFSSTLNSETFENSSGKELTLIGEEKLKKISINSFFPHKLYRWMPFLSFLAPECLSFLTKHRKSILRVTVISSEITFSYPCIIKDFNWKKKANKDIDYSITIEEYVNR
ncbi:hypothetical protein [Fusobacterium sp.]|uniref:hypothetical protein n=1 Tax=Fusobacterium sp. TaxID=68766 RepID=UPI0026378455|nr:hypothetical protein [Fusobacterium sp.]